MTTSADAGHQTWLYVTTVDGSGQVLAAVTTPVRGWVPELVQPCAAERESRPKKEIGIRLKTHQAVQASAKKEAAVARLIAVSHERPGQRPHDLVINPHCKSNPEFHLVIVAPQRGDTCPGYPPGALTLECGHSAKSNAHGQSRDRTVIKAEPSENRGTEQR